MEKELLIRVKTWLTINGMNQGELARMLGISGAYLSDILHGKRRGEHIRRKITDIIEQKEVS